MKYASLFFQYAAQYMKTRMAYRTDMFVEIGSDFLAQAVNFLFILLVFGHTTDISGWSRDEVILLKMKCAAKGIRLPYGKSEKQSALLQVPLFTAI